jgi:hypothetical protein
MKSNLLQAGKDWLHLKTGYFAYILPAAGKK